jgi:uncharacterized membrane protein (DUF106 family)
MCARRIRKVGVEEHKPQVQPSVARAGGGFTRFIMIFLVILVVMMLFDPNLRMGFASAVGVVMEPLVGFGGAYPVWTLFCAGIIMTVFSGIVRHFFVDWVEMARVQSILKAFNKERLDALRSNNVAKQKALQAKQPEIMQLNMKNMKSQLKTMAVTMFVIIAVFTWIWLFIESLPNKTFSAPWALDAQFTDAFILPYWIILYAGISIPIGQLAQRLLKHYSFKKRLQRLQEESV